MIKYEELAKRYKEIYERSFEKFLCYLRPRVLKTIRLAKKGEKRCIESSEDKEEYLLERFLKEVYFVNYFDEFHSLPLLDIISIKKSCESISGKIRDRKLTKKENRSLYSIAREFNGNGDVGLLKKLCDF